VLVSYSSLCGHFTCASEDVRLDSKERTQFNGLANKLSSVHFLLNVALMPDDKSTDRSRNSLIITNCTTCCNGANLQLNFELCHVKYYSLSQNGFVLVVHTVFLVS